MDFPLLSSHTTDRACFQLLLICNPCSCMQSTGPVGGLLLLFRGCLEDHTAGQSVGNVHIMQVVLWSSKGPPLLGTEHIHSTMD